MIRLTVLSNLKPFVDEEEFLKWRLGEHQHSNAAIPGVLRTDFARVEGVWPDGAPVPYRFMTTADWPDMESFRAAFYEPQALAALAKNLEMLSEPIFLISEILVNQIVDAKSS